MKRSFFALGLALSLAFAACQKDDMPGPSCASGSGTDCLVSGAKKPAPQLRQLGTQRIRPAFNQLVTCAPYEPNQHAEPIHVNDTVLILTPLRASASGGLESVEHQWSDGDPNRPERFPREATK